MPPACCISLAESIKQTYLRLQLGYKIIALLTLVMFIVITYIPLHYELINHVVLVVQQKQYWRLFSSFLTNGSLSMGNAIYVIICFYFLNQSIRQIESKYSTIYILIEIVKQTFLINLIITVLTYPFISLNLLPSWLLPASYISPPGLLLPMINFVWQSAIKSDSLFQLPFLPCEFKKKYLLVVLLIVLFGVIRMDFITLGIVTIVSMLQHLCLKKPLFALPIGLYRAINRCLPRKVRKIHGYIDVESVKDNLLQVCQGWGREAGSERTLQLHEIAMQQSNFQKYWSDKEVRSGGENETNNSEINNNTLNISEEIHIDNNEQEQQQQQINQQLGESHCNITQQTPIHQQETLTQQTKTYQEHWKSIQINNTQELPQVSRENQCSIPQQSPIHEPQTISQSNKTYKEHWKSVEINHNQQSPQIFGQQVDTDITKVTNPKEEERKSLSQSQSLNQVLSKQQEQELQPSQLSQPPLQNPPLKQLTTQPITKAASAFDEQQQWY